MTWVKQPKEAQALFEKQEKCLIVSDCFRYGNRNYEIAVPVLVVVFMSQSVT